MIKYFIKIFLQDDSAEHLAEDVKTCLLEKIIQYPKGIMYNNNYYFIR